MFPPYTAVDLIRVLQEGIDHRDAKLRVHGYYSDNEKAPASPNRKNALRGVIRWLQMLFNAAPFEPAVEPGAR